MRTLQTLSKIVKGCLFYRSIVIRYTQIWLFFNEYRQRNSLSFGWLLGQSWTRPSSTVSWFPTRSRFSSTRLVFNQRINISEFDTWRILSTFGVLKYLIVLQSTYNVQPVEIKNIHSIQIVFFVYVITTFLQRIFSIIEDAHTKWRLCL